MEGGNSGTTGSDKCISKEVKNPGSPKVTGLQDSLKITAENDDDEMELKWDESDNEKSLDNLGEAELTPMSSPKPVGPESTGVLNTNTALASEAETCQDPKLIDNQIIEKDITEIQVQNSPSYNMAESSSNNKTSDIINQEKTTSDIFNISISKPEEEKHVVDINDDKSNKDHEIQKLSLNSIVVDNNDSNKKDNLCLAKNESIPKMSSDNTEHIIGDDVSSLMEDKEKVCIKGEDNINQEDLQVKMSTSNTELMGSVELHNQDNKQAIKTEIVELSTLRNSEEPEDTSQAKVSNIPLTEPNDQSNASINKLSITSAGDSEQIIIKDEQIKTEAKDVIGEKEQATTEEVMDVDMIESLNLPSTSSDPTIQTCPSELDAHQMPDMSDEVPEVTDSLGLLAESHHTMHDDDDEDEDLDLHDDGETNQITEQSEDSNAHHSETEKQMHSDIEMSDVTMDGYSEKEVVTNMEEMVTEGYIVTEGDMVTEEDIVTEGETVAEESVLVSDKVEVVEEGLVEEKGEVMEEGIVDTDKEDIAVEKEMSVCDKIETIAQVGSISKTENEAIKDIDSVEDKAKEESEEKNIDVLKSLLLKPNTPPPPPIQIQKEEQVTPKKKVLEFSSPKSRKEVNIVDLGESSSEDDVQETPNIKTKESEAKQSEVELERDNDTLTAVNIPLDVDAMVSGSGHMTHIVAKEGEFVIDGLPQPKSSKTASLNTNEIPIKSVNTNDESSLSTAEAKVDNSEVPTKPKIGLEVFNLDSDDEDTNKNENSKVEEKPQELLEVKSVSVCCVNPLCKSDKLKPLSPADGVVLRYYDAKCKKRRQRVCEECANDVYARTELIMEGVKQMGPLLEIDTSKQSQELVEISDSDSEDEAEEIADYMDEEIGDADAEMLEKELADIINSSWKKYSLDDRLNAAKQDLEQQMKELDLQCTEIDQMMNDCQRATDKLRSDLYATFARRNTEHCLDLDEDCIQPGERRSKRLRSVFKDDEQSDGMAKQSKGNKTDDDDNTDIKVVKLCVEHAPSDLPGPGQLVRESLRVGDKVYATRETFGHWLVANVLECLYEYSGPNKFPIYKVCFERKSNNAVTQLLSTKNLAYYAPAAVRLVIGTRVIALFDDKENKTKKSTYYSGIIAEMPNPVNSYRYLIFFDDGYAQYATHTNVRVVCGNSTHVWDDVQPQSREFVREYIVRYPERPMVRLHAGQTIKTEWNGKWWVSKVIKVDASLVQVHFEADNRTEWIYRGSTRLAPLFLELQAAERHRSRAMPRSTAARKNMPYVEYNRTEEQTPTKDVQTQQSDERRQRAVAKKSTASSTSAPAPAAVAQMPLENIISRVVYYTPKSAVKPLKMVPHTCSVRCKRTDVLPLKELRTYNPLARPLLSGWERQIVRIKFRKEVMYRAPCGRRLRNMRELHRYLMTTRSEMAVDLFDYSPQTHCLAEFVLNRCLVSKKDLSHGKENVPVPCVNYYDNSLPEFCSYNTERTPTAGVPLNLDTDFMCGCDCKDDCQDKTKCNCWKMTLEGAKTIGMDPNNSGYDYKRLLEPVPSGIYECNSRCKCRETCLNRVAQHPLQLKLQVFKTLNRGWGIRALNDIPRGSFLCVYAGNLLTDATANLDGLNEGDEYLAELDYIEVVEQMKEGYEEDVPELDKELDKKKEESEESHEESESDGDENVEQNDDEDDEFKPGYLPGDRVGFNKKLRQREKKVPETQQETTEKEKEAEKAKSEKEKSEKETKGEDCITISDDEEVREPSRFTAQAGIDEFVSKYKSLRSYFGKDEACYIMDAKVQGNIGRYLNHSCMPNVFVQNVFVDTHDPRFPWVAFFALKPIKAGCELTWNYNYDIGSVPGRSMACHCGAPNCRGRLL